MEPGEAGVEDGGAGAGHIAAPRGGDLEVGEEDGGQQRAGQEDAHQAHTHHIAGAAAAHAGDLTCNDE